MAPSQETELGPVVVQQVKLDIASAANEPVLALASVHNSFYASAIADRVSRKRGVLAANEMCHCPFSPG
jgi:hypothetical protein